MNAQRSTLTLPKLTLTCAAMIGLASGSLLAQGSTTRHLAVCPGQEQPSRAGFSVDAVGDLDGDGFAETLAGAPEAAGTKSIGAWVGRVTVMAGRDGRRLFDVEGTQHQGRLGWAVCGLGDVDGDGVRDFAAGAPYESHNGYRSGVVYVWSGKTFQLLRTLSGDAADYLGVSLANPGDIDGDGVDDIFAGGHGGPVQNQGVALLWSGKTGKRLHRFLGTSIHDFLGHAVSGAGDLNGDGTPDLLIGIPDEDSAGNNAGKVVAYSGKDFKVLWSHVGDAATDNFGHAVCVIGDVNGDQIGDVAVGAPQFTPTSLGAGYVRILSGKTGVSLKKWHGKKLGDWFGEPVSPVGDWNGDGTPDLLVGSSRAAEGSTLEVGRADILSGKDGTVLQQWCGSMAGSRFGFAARLAGDVNGDGQPDLVFGAPGDDSSRGLVRVDTKTPPELTIGANEVSITGLNRAHMSLELPKKYEGQLYLALGSVSGRSPGISVGSVTIPLRADFYTDMLLVSPNTFVMPGFGLVPFGGKVRLSFGLSAGFSPSLAGTRFDHSVLLIDVNKLQFTHATNAVALRLVQ